MSKSELLNRGEYSEKIIFENWRLQGINISELHGENKRGWYTRGTHLVPESADSTQTPFSPLILLVPPRLIGTHEDVIGDPYNPSFVPPGYATSGFAGIDFSNGWKGSPIAAAVYAPCLGNEIINPDLPINLISTLSANGGLGILDDLEYGDLGILDGHHRRALAEAIGLKYVPVQIIPYLFDPSVILDTWHDDGVVWTAEQVFACFKIPGLFADAKRTKFGILGRDGTPRRILDAQPHIEIPLHNLV